MGPPTLVGSGPSYPASNKRARSELQTDPLLTSQQEGESSHTSITLSLNVRHSDRSSIACASTTSPQSCGHSQLVSKGRGGFLRKRMQDTGSA